MLLRPWFLLSRTRLIIAAVIAALFAILGVWFACADSWRDIGIFWHQIPSSNLSPIPARILTNPFTFSAMLLPIILGMGVGVGGANTPGLQGQTRFLVTRPVRRRNLILKPLLIAALATAILPALAWLLVLGWLKLVHAPALGHLLALAEMVPTASTLGPHPTFLALMEALSMPRRYLAGLSVGVSYYAILASQPWLIAHPNPRVKFLGALLFATIYLPMMRVFGPHFISAVMLWPSSGESLTWLPSTLAITLHFAFAAAVIFGTLRLVHQADL